MRWYLGPRLELANSDASLHWPSSVRTVDSHDSVDDQLGLERRLEAELRHVLNKRFDARLHYATGALWRIDMKRASLTMETISSSAKRFVWGRSFPTSSPKSKVAGFNPARRKSAEADWLRSSVVKGWPSMVNGMGRRIASMLADSVNGLSFQGWLHLMSQSVAAAKLRATTFSPDAVCDNKAEMLSNSQKFDSQHPLLADKDRLERILDIMYAKIQKTLFPRGYHARRVRADASQPNNGGGIERILKGTEVSADDVLSEALSGLLQYPPERLEDTWEGLAVKIAGNKAIDALRASQKGLGGTDHRVQLHLVSGDVERDGSDGEAEPALFDLLPSTWGDPEAEYSVLEDVLKLRDLARELLDDRDRAIFFAIHFRGDSRKEVGDRLGLTSQRIGQIYSAALDRLEAHPDYPKNFGQSETRRN